MKKNKIRTVIMALLACAALMACVVLTGCKTQPLEETPVVPDPVVTTPDPTPQPQPGPEPEPEAEPEPEPEPEPLEWVSGMARAGYGGSVMNVFSLGDAVTVIGEYDGYFLIKGEEHDLLIETRYLRHAGENAFEERDGYSYGGTAVYATAHLDTNPDSDEDVIATLTLNTKVRVIEGKENWLHIIWDEGEGYVDEEGISNSYITYRGGGGGGPADGTDIDLSGLSAYPKTMPGIVLLGGYHGPKYTEMEPCEGVILTDLCEAYLYLFDRGEEVRVHEVGEEQCVVLIGDDITAVVPRWLITMEGDEVYESWTGYARGGAELYSRYQMRELYLKDTLATNTEVLVLDELSDCYIVEINGEIGYVLIDDISRTRIVYYGGGGGGGGGGDWTPPAL